jgi:hypothetical protein
MPARYGGRSPRRLSHYGFAHGVAGIGYFLLAAGQAVERDDLLGLAIEAGDTLVRAAIRADGAALWPTDIDRPEDAVEHWCSGSAGIGAYLVRLWQATGRPEYRDLAEEAAAAAWRRRWYASPVACHGLAGIGELLLDLATASADARYLVRAEAIGDLIEARHAVRDGRRLIPDETNTGFGTEYGTGMAGALDFLLRLRHGGPRAWMVDPAVAPNLRDGTAGRSQIVSIVDKEQVS